MAIFHTPQPFEPWNKENLGGQKAPLDRRAASDKASASGQERSLRQTRRTVRRQRSHCAQS